MKSISHTLAFLRFLPLVTSSQSPLPRESDSPITVPIFNDLAHQHYLINLSVGTPPSQYSVLLDTGSTDFWLPAWNSSGCYPDCRPGTFKPGDSSTAVDTGIPFNVSYGLTPGPGWLGEYYNETISLGHISITNQTMATANVPSPINPSTFWGILGLASRYGTSSFTNPWSPVFHQLNDTYVPLWEHLYESGLVPKRLFSVWLNKQSASFGSVTFGGIENEGAKYAGDLKTTPVLLSGPLFTGWAVNLTSVSRTTTTTSSNASYPTTNTEPLTASTFSAQVILDTGSPNMYLPSSLYSEIVAPLSPVYETNPEGNPTPYVDCEFRTSQPETYFTFGFPGTKGAEGPSISVPLEELILPFGQPENLGEVRGEDGGELCYLGVLQTPGPVFLLGATFLRSEYAVYSGEGGVWSVSMAQAKFA